MIIIEKKDKIFLGILFIVSLLIRAGVYQWYLSNNQRYWQVDSNTYHLVAQEIAKDNGISQANGQPNFYRLPGYPVFIAFFYKLFGPQPTTFLWIQVVLASCIPLLIFLLVLGLFPRRRWLAYCASLYSSIHLGLVLYSGFFMSETLFIFFFLLFSLMFLPNVHWWFCRSVDIERWQDACRCQPDMFTFLPDETTESPAFTAFYEKIQEAKHAELCQTPAVDVSYKYFLLAGIFLGLASMVRPVGHYVLVVALFLLLFSYDGWKKKLTRAAVLVGSWLIVVLPWLLRNYLLLGHLFFHTLPGGHFLYFSAARVVASVDQCSYAQAKDKVGHEVNQRMQDEERIKHRELTEIERCYVHEHLARHYFVQHPLVTMKLWLTDIFRTCFSLYSAELLYLEADRPEFDYFSSKRGIWSLFARYLFPQTNNWYLKLIVYLEILLFLFMLTGCLLSFVFLLGGMLRGAALWNDVCSMLSMLSFIALFLVIALAGGYARMRLPIEPFIIIIGWYGWLSVASLCTKGVNRG